MLGPGYASHSPRRTGLRSSLFVYDRDDSAPVCPESEQLRGDASDYHFGKVVIFYGVGQLGETMEQTRLDSFIARHVDMVFGWRVYGLGVMAVGMACLAFGGFDPGQPVPKNFPPRALLAYVAGAFMVVGAAAAEWRRTAAWGAAALTVYYTLFV